MPDLIRHDPIICRGWKSELYPTENWLLCCGLKDVQSKVWMQIMWYQNERIVPYFACIGTLSLQQSHFWRRTIFCTGSRHHHMQYGIDSDLQVWCQMGNQASYAGRSVRNLLVWCLVRWDWNPRTWRKIEIHCMMEDRSWSADACLTTKLVRSLCKRI